MKLEDLAHLPTFAAGEEEKLETAVVKEYAKITLKIPYSKEQEVTDVYQVVGSGTRNRVPKDLSPVLYIRRHNLNVSSQGHILDLPDSPGKTYQVFIIDIVEYQSLVPKKR